MVYLLQLRVVDKDEIQNMRRDIDLDVDIDLDLDLALG